VTVPPFVDPEEGDDTPPEPPDLTVEYDEPTPVAQLFAPDGAVLLEVMNRYPAGYR
jgi:hypothetical protein